MTDHAGRGRFITLEGGEGAGKTTQLRRLVDYLGRAGQNVRATREPGGTQGAEEIRTLVTGGKVDRWHPMTELLLMMAARSDHIERVIRPSLARGEWVVSDRFHDSSRVYQGLAGGLGLDTVDRLHEPLLDGVLPDLTLILDLPVETGLARRKAVFLGVLDLAIDIRRAQQRLGGDAAPVEADAAEVRLFDHRRLHSELRGAFSGKLVMEVLEDAAGDSHLLLDVERARGGEGDDAALADAVARRVVDALLAASPEFGAYVPEARRRPQVRVWAHGHPQHFPVGVKHRYVRA